MKHLFILLILSFIAFSSISQGKFWKWNDSFEKRHLKNREDSTTWDRELLQRDIDDSISNSKGKPFPHGAFPVPKYDLAGKFRYGGAGVGGSFRNYFGKKLVCSFFFANATAANQRLLKKENEVFFIFVMLTDFIDTVNYTHGSAYILSRNNPAVTCEGFYKTQTDEVDFMAFLTPNRDEFAVVNMRLFNLKFGRIILITPQKDHSLRSLQLKAPVLSNKDARLYLDKVLEKDNVKSFFINKGNI